MKKSKLLTLEILRVLIIFGVFICHFTTIICNSEKYSYLGMFGVSFFIILSGFVMFYTHGDEYYNLTLKKNINFIFNRLKKIYSLFLITSIICIPTLFYHENTIKDIAIKSLFNFIMIKSWVGSLDIAQSYNAVTWFVSTLFFMYMLTPALLVLVNKTMKKISTCVIISLFIFFIQILLASIKYSNEEFGIWFIYESPYCRILDYMLGILLAKIYCVGDYQNNKLRLSNKDSVIEIMVILIWCIQAKFSYGIPTLYKYGVYWTPICCLMIFTFSKSQGKISELLNCFCNKCKLYKYTYNFYLIHYVVIIYVLFLHRFVLKIDMNYWGEIIDFCIIFIMSLYFSALFSRISFKLKSTNR